MTDQSQLDARLGQYAITARGQIAKGRSLTQLAGFATAAGASLAMAGAAEAAIVYSGVVDRMVSADPSAQATNATNIFFTNVSSQGLDIDGGGDDIKLSAGMHAMRNVENDAKYDGGGLLQIAGGARFLGTSFASNLASGALIGPGGTFNAATAGPGLAKIFYSGVLQYSSAIPGFAVSTTALVGIRLGSNKYGWIRFGTEDLGANQPFATLRGSTLQDGSGFADKITVIDWAYEDSGAAIAAGDTGDIPAPSPLALLAAGAIGLAGWRGRRASADRR
jgi:hypothetical protein